MRAPAKAFILTLISSVTFALGVAPAHATHSFESFELDSAAVVSTGTSQSLSAARNAAETHSLDSMLSLAEVGNLPHNFDVALAIAQAESEVGTSRATGWGRPGECMVSAKRWLTSAGAAWTGRGNPLANFEGAIRLTPDYAQPGDIIQYEHIARPSSWVSGVHTVLVTETNGDGTFTIIQSNWPGGSGLVTKVENWVPEPPNGFSAVVWRF